MKKITIIIFIFSFTILFAQKRTISGSISGFNENAIVVLGDSDKGKIIEKSTLKNSSFIFENPYSKLTKRYYLNIKENSIWYTIHFFADNDNITITGNKKDYPNNIIVKGSKSNKEKLKFEESYENFKNKSDSINNLIGIKKLDSIKYSKDEIKKEREIYSNLNKQIENIKLENIKSNPNSYIALVELFELKEKIGKEEVRKLYRQINNNLKQTNIGVNIKIYLDLETILTEGNDFEDFQAKDIEGNYHKISEYKGKYILLDFIQTYCSACILSLDDLKIINEKYKDEVKIITFCGDKSEETWKTGYQKYEIQWLSLWNGEGLNGRINQLYGIEGTPTFILINPYGKIVKKYLGYDKGYLEELLETELNKK